MTSPKQLKPSLHWGGREVTISSGDCWATFECKDGGYIAVRGRRELLRLHGLLAAALADCAAEDDREHSTWFSQDELYLESRGGRLYTSNNDMLTLAQIDLNVAKDLLDWLEFATNESYPRRTNGCLSGRVTVKNKTFSCLLSSDKEGSGFLCLETSEPVTLQTTLLAASANRSSNISPDYSWDIPDGNPMRSIMLLNGEAHFKTLSFKPGYLGPRDCRLTRVMSYCDMVELALGIWLAQQEEAGA